MRCHFSIMTCLLVLSQATTVLAADDYSIANQVVAGHATYHLRDARRHMEVGIVPDLGNYTYEFKANGKDVLIPAPPFPEYIQKHTFGWGIPFLAPYANRIDHDYYYFERKKYLLNDSLGNMMRDQFQQPLHGVLAFEKRWEILESRASDSEGAVLRTRLNFYEYPDLMAQFPFAHFYVVTFRLRDGRFSITTEVHNFGKSDMPVLFAYHPYFRPPGPREDWILANPAQYYWLLNDHLTPTGEALPATKLIPNGTGFKLGKMFLDNVFSGLPRDAQGLGHVWVKGEGEMIEEIYDRGFDFAVVYAPLDQSLICIEPQTGPTNAFNLAHEGKFNNLVVLAPGKTYSATFWIVPRGF